jgi:hypothetical protein
MSTLVRINLRDDPSDSECQKCMSLAKTLAVIIFVLAFAIFIILLGQVMSIKILAINLQMLSVCAAIRLDYYWCYFTL